MLRIGFPFALRLLVCVAVVLSAWLAPTPSHAQRDANLERLIASFGESGKAADRSPVPQSSVSPVNLQVHWRLWKRVFSSGKPGKDELTALEHDGRSLGRVNQPEYAMAVVALASSHGDARVASELFESAARLAPDLPYVEFAHSAYVFRHDISNFPRWASTYWRASKKAVLFPDTGFPWALKLALYVLLALAGASVLFVFGQLVRHFPILAYDLSRIMPRGFSSNQTVVLLVALVVVPGLLLQSPLVSVLLLLAAVSLVQHANERLVTALFFGLIAALPLADRLLVDLSTYQGSTAQTLARAQYISCDAACREDLEGRLHEAPEDAHLLYTALLAGYRTGDRAALDRIVEVAADFAWPDQLRGHAENLRGAALVALARPDEAVEALERARARMPGEAAPAFNLMRAYQMQDNLEQASSALREATAADIDRVTDHLRLERRDVNSFLMATPLPLTTFWRYHRDRVRKDISVISRFWTSLAGRKVPFDWGMYLGLAGLAMAVLGSPLSRKGATSTPCPRCGLARDPVDAAKTGDHHYCLPCYRTFVTGAGLDYDARVHNERVLGRRESLQAMFRRVFSVVAPGLGHHMAGRAVDGFLLTFFLLFGALIVARPLGVVRPPFELLGTNWAAQVTIGWVLVSVAVFVALGAAWRDVAPLTFGGANKHVRR